MHYLKDSFEEMEGESRLKQQKPETVIRKEPERRKTGKKSRRIKQKHPISARNFSLFCRRFLRVNVPKLGILHMLSHGFRVASVRHWHHTHHRHGCHEDGRWWWENNTTQKHGFLLIFSFFFWVNEICCTHRQMFEEFKE